VVYPNLELMGGEGDEDDDDDDNKTNNSIFFSFTEELVQNPKGQ